MKYSQKNAPPQVFLDWLALKNANWSPTYKNLRKPELPAVRDALLQEQEYICCYCGRQLNGDHSDSHVDHFRPQKHYNGKGLLPDLTLSYDNFVASCGSPKSKELPNTCGQAKGSRFKEVAHIAPWDPGCEARFSYGSSGIVLPVQGEDEAAIEMIDTLRLDDASLVADRSVVLMAIEADIQAGLIHSNNVGTEIARLRTALNGKRSSFSHVAARYLEDEVKSVDEVATD